MKPGRLVVLTSISLALIVVSLTLFILKDVVFVKPKPRGEGVRIVGEVIYLPLPRVVSTMTVEEALLNRKSVREWRGEPLTVEQVSTILWCAYGVTEVVDSWVRRTSPSAGATYPLEIYLVVGEKGVEVNQTHFLEAGVYRYDVPTHSLILFKRGDFREVLYEAALRQTWVRDAPASIVITAVYERTTRRYGERGVRYVHMEAGHVGQNIYLCATALELGTVAIGAFIDEKVAEIVETGGGEEPLYIYPIGIPAKPYEGSFQRVHEEIQKAREK